MPRPSLGTPSRFLLAIGVPIGLVFVFLAPPWAAGADESTHFARTVDIAHGNLVPGETPDGTGSAIPRTYRRDQDRVAANYVAGRAPVNADLVGDLLDSRPTWDETVFFDTRPTTASSPVGYLPGAAAMAIPDAAGWPGVVVLWAGRLGDLAAFLGLAWLATRTATAFGWTLALGALFPLNLALAASVTPDAVTIGALLLVLGVWTRVWSPPATQPAPRRVAVEVGGAGLLLALAKPPYFLILAAFPALWLLRRRDPTARAGALAAAGAALVGLAFTVVNSANNYQAVTDTLIDSIEYQPEVQRERLLSDPLGFLWISVRTFATELDDYVQSWTRQLGLWTTDLPVVVPWVVLAVLVAAAVRLDGADLAALAGRVRALLVIAVVAFVLVLYGSSYVYFDDTEEGVRIGRQMGRYVLPLFPVAVLALAPRHPAVRAVLARAGTTAARAAAAGALAVAAVGAAATWLVTGTAAGT